MQRNVPLPLPAETLSAMWFNLHSDERFGVRSNEVHYFNSLAVALDDDLASLLLLKKLKLAREYCSGTMPRDIVSLNRSFVFAIEGGESHRGRLVHGTSLQQPDAIPTSSRVGIGLLGLRPGQRILWPDEHDRMRGLEVLRVESGRAYSRPQNHWSSSS